MKLHELQAAGPLTPSVTAGVDLIYVINTTQEKLLFAFNPSDRLGSQELKITGSNELDGCCFRIFFISLTAQFFENEERTKFW